MDSAFRDHYQTIASGSQLATRCEMESFGKSSAYSDLSPFSGCSPAFTRTGTALNYCEHGALRASAEMLHSSAHSLSAFSSIVLSLVYNKSFFLCLKRVSRHLQNSTWCLLVHSPKKKLQELMQCLSFPAPRLAKLSTDSRSVLSSRQWRWRETACVPGGFTPRVNRCKLWNPVECVERKSSVAET